MAKSQEFSKDRQQQRGERGGEKKSDFEEKVLFINRCAKVVKGGRKFHFSALILVGDGKGRVGFGLAKANELTDAIRRGGEVARRNMTNFAREGTTIPHEITVRWDGAVVFLKPAPKGTGVIAGSRVRAILEMAGVEDVVAKSMGANNPVNLVRATFKALKSLRSREDILKARGVA